MLGLEVISPTGVTELSSRGMLLTGDMFHLASLRAQLSVLFFSSFLLMILRNIDADTNMPLYADDAKCFRELLSLDDHDALQKDLYSIEDWSDLWGMSFNGSKCKHLSIS